MADKLFDCTEELRSYIMDEEDFNFLNLNKEVLADKKLHECIADAIADWNMTLPLTNKTLSAFSANEWSLIKKKAAVEAIYRLMFLNANNRVTYSDQGFNATEYNNYDLFASLKQDIERDYESKKTQYKQAESYRGAMGGGVHSEYWLK